jgi:hypothetical protein
VGPAESQSFFMSISVAPGVNIYSVACPPATPEWKATGGGIILSSLQVQIRGSYQHGNAWEVMTNNNFIVPFDAMVSVSCYRTH